MDKVDPPNWWIGLPDPMLLVHGDHLRGARFTVSGGSAISIGKVRISGNGHWAFVWLLAGHAHSGKLLIHASTEDGGADLPFDLCKRKPATGRFQGFSSADIMYLIMTDRFADGDPSNDHQAYAPGDYDRSKSHGWHGGDFRGIEQHLDYLQQLGVTTVWTTPAYDNGATPQAYHGYSAVDMYAVDPHFGTLADYESLAEAVHRRGMKLVLDTVPNHVGPLHPWVNDPPTPDWFHGTLQHHIAAKSNFRPLVDPHSDPQQSQEVTDGWFVDLLPDMNQENPLVSKYLIQNAEWWVESAGLDGLRLDTFPFVGRAFWHDFHSQLHTLYPRLTTVGEIFHPDPAITSYFVGGVPHRGIDTGLDTPFDYPVYFTLRETLIKGLPMTRLADILCEDRLYPHPERLVTFEGNHDTMRFLHEKGATVASLKLAFGLLATMRGMPQIYSGDEIAMDGADDPDNRRDFPGGFPGDKENAFTLQERSPEQREVHDWVSQLMRFRDLHSTLQTGQQQDIFVDDTVFVFTRAANISIGCAIRSPNIQDERFLVIVNNSDQERTLLLDTKNTALDGCFKFADAVNAKKAIGVSGSKVMIPLAPKQLVIYSVK